MSLSQEQAAFLLDACKLIQYSTEQGILKCKGLAFKAYENLTSPSASAPNSPSA